MNMVYAVYEKNLRTDKVCLAEIFDDIESAQKWMENMTTLWIEERGYKIVEDGDS
jgi:hypothetical protein